MKQCIIADFEWCVTPHPTGDRFQYYNEILSAGAVRIDETGAIIDRFYSLIRPERADYLHPVILSSLRLDRQALAAAPAFPEVFRQFLAFVGNTRVFTWGCADRSALIQNLCMKASFSREKADAAAPQMRDLQPILSRGAGISPPYPSLASVLNTLSIKSENRHNAMADAEDTAQIVSLLCGRDPMLCAPLFSGSTAAGQPQKPSTASESSASFRTPGESLNAARRHARLCPVCQGSIGVGTWIRVSKTEIVTLCCCETDGRFLCTVTAAENEDGTFTAGDSITPFEGPQKARYEAVRRSARMHRLKQAKAAPDSTVQALPNPAAESIPDTQNTDQ